MVRLNTAAFTELDSLFIPVSFPTHLSHSATGLVDSSSMHCFIDTQFANKLGLSPYNIHPLRLRLLNRSFSLRITRTIDLTIHHSTGDVIGVTFYVTQLDSPIALIFGYNWLYRYNPLIDWYSSQILSFQTLLQKVSKPTLIGPQLSELQPTDFLLPQLELPLTDSRSLSRESLTLRLHGSSQSHPVLSHQKLSNPSHPFLLLMLQPIPAQLAQKDRYLFSFHFPICPFMDDLPLLPLPNLI